MPAAAQIEAKDFAIARALLRKAGDLGLMSVDVPEAYRGLEMDKVTSALIAESMSRLAGFSVAFSALAGISAPHRLVRRRRAKGEVPAQARHRRVDRRHVFKPSDTIAVGREIARHALGRPA